MVFCICINATTLRCRDSLSGVVHCDKSHLQCNPTVWAKSPPVPPTMYVLPGLTGIEHEQPGRKILFLDFPIPWQINFLAMLSLLVGSIAENWKPFARQSWCPGVEPSKLLLQIIWGSSAMCWVCSPRTADCTPPPPPAIPPPSPPPHATPPPATPPPATPPAAAAA